MTHDLTADLLPHRTTALLQRLSRRPFFQTPLGEFLLFGIKQGWACLFGGAMVGLIIATSLFWPAHSPVARYDFLFVSAVTIQVLLLAFRLETLQEAKVILIFHVIGTAMEVFKTAHGSWEYPEANLIRIGGVPLFSGFMYAAVGSYIARAIRLFDIEYDSFPPRWATLLLGTAIYANFFAHHFMFDSRGLLFLVIGAMFGKSHFYFTPARTQRRMPIIVGFGLVTFFIWLAENIGTLGTVWLYPQQKHGWQLVPVSKMGSWFLLMIISFILVSLVHQPRLKRQK